MTARRPEEIKVDDYDAEHEQEDGPIPVLAELVHSDYCHCPDNMDTIVPLDSDTMLPLVSYPPPVLHRRHIMTPAQQEVIWQLFHSIVITS